MNRNHSFINQLLNNNAILVHQYNELIKKNYLLETQIIELKNKLTEKDAKLRELMEKYDIYPTPFFKVSQNFE